MSREADDGASLADLEWAIELLTTRCRVRWDRLYGASLLCCGFPPSVADFDFAHTQDFMSFARSTSTINDSCIPLPTTWSLRRCCLAMRKSSRRKPLGSPVSRRISKLRTDAPAHLAFRVTVWPIPIKLPRNPELIHEDKMICLRNSGVDWSEYALPDQPTGTSEPARRRIERGVPAMEETVAEPDADVRAIESTTTPLLNQLDRDARSSGFFSTFGSFLRRRHL